MHKCSGNFLGLAAVVGLVALMSACGGGQSGSGGSGGLNPPDFALAVSPSSLVVASGTGGTVQVTLSPVNSFSGTATVQTSSIPSGIMLSESQFNVSAASAQSITVSTSPSVAAGNYSLTFQGSSGSLSHSATLAVTVNAAIPAPSRADFIPTYDTPVSATYDMARKLVYVSNPTRGAVDVVSSTTYQVLKSIPVPSPRGLDISIDGSKVYVGTATQALFVIDATTQKISQRYFTPAPPPGAADYASEPEKPVETSNGKLLLLATTNTGIVQITSWDLSTNTYQVRSDVPNNNFDTTSVMARSGDGTKVIFSNDVEPSELFLYDSATDSFVTASVPFFAFSVAANANGTQFSVASDKICVFDAQLNVLSTLPGSAPLQYSPDGSKLYLVGFLGSVPVVQTFDMQTYALVGTAPSYATNIAYFERIPPLIQELPLVADETGRLFGAADHGLAIDDTTDLRSYSGSEIFPVDNIIVNPAEGTVDLQQGVQIQTESYTTAPSIWFGGFSGSNTQVGLPYLTSTTPGLSSIGAVNVRLLDSDGVQSFIPQAYSYGSLLVSSPDLAASSAGGGNLSVFGYGLGALGGAQVTTKVSIGSSAAQVTKASPFATEQGYPFSMTHVQFQAPAASAGEYDLGVSSAAGSATAKDGYHSLVMTSYPLDGQGYAIVYDGGRNHVYVSAADHVDVFSLTSGAFLPPIAIPTLNGVSQLGGMALSPNGSSLLVTNWADGSVVIVNSDDLSTQIVAVVPPANSTAWLQGPQTVALGNNGKALISVAGAPTGSTSIRHRSATTKASPTSGSGNGPFANLWELDLATLTVTPLAFASGGTASPLSLKATDAGSKICIAGEYQPLSLYDSATDTFQPGPGQGGLGDCAVDGPTVVAAGTPFSKPALLDLALDFNGGVSLTDYMQYSLSAEANVTGLLVDPQGAVVFQPYTQSILFFEAHTGQILERIAMPTNIERISNGALARDTTGLQIFALTDSGLTIIHLDTLPLAIGSITSQGGTWTISGTGFVQGTSVSATV